MKTKIVVASLVLGAAATGIAHAEQVVTIAISGPLTGPQSVSGKDDENGLRLAIESLNQKPIQVGGQPVRFRMMSEDDQADPRTGVQVAQRLLDQRPVAFFGPQNSGVAIPVARLTSAARVPMLTVASNPQLTTLGYDNLFRTGASDSVLGASMAAFAAGKLGAKTAAVIDDRTAYGQGLAEQFIDKAKSLGLQVVAREFTHSQANDFLGILATIKGKNPDVIFFGGYTAQAAPMARQMVQRGVRAKLLGGDGICSVNMAQVAQAASRNVFCAMSGTGLEGTEPGRDYIARYRARFKSEPQTYGITYYDGMMLLAKTMEAAQTTDPAKLIPALRSASHRGVAATYAFTKQGELLDAPTTVFTFENGQMTPVR